MEYNQKLYNGAAYIQNSNPNIDLVALVYDFLQYKFSRQGFVLNIPEKVGEAGVHSNVNKVGNALRSMADQFSLLHLFVVMDEQLEVNESTMKLTVESVANRLFDEGITWDRIMGFFLFGSELAIHCKKRNWPDLINILAVSLSSYISEKLLIWINDHGGWDGLVVYNEGEYSELQSSNRWPSVKNLLCLGIGAIGALTIGAVIRRS